MNKKRQYRWSGGEGSDTHRTKENAPKEQKKTEKAKKGEKKKGRHTLHAALSRAARMCVSRDRGGASETPLYRAPKMGARYGTGDT